MKKSSTDLKILLLQIRTDKVTLHEELEEFIVFSGLNRSQFSTLNAFENKSFSPSIINNYDALFIGGSSDASVLDPITYDFLPSCKALLRTCYENDIPTLASCFGFQLAVEEFGGKVILDKENMEIGLYQINLSDDIKNDRLLYDCPNDFWAVSGHKERAQILPQNALHLGKTELCPYHIFTFPNKPFYAFQFHPEVNTIDLIDRITRYKTRYLESSDSLQQIIDDAIYPTIESNLIIKKFVERIVLS